MVPRFAKLSYDMTIGTQITNPIANNSTPTNLLPTMYYNIFSN